MLRWFAVEIVGERSSPFTQGKQLAEFSRSWFLRAWCNRIRPLFRGFAARLSR
jgi:hypothetical protein